MGMAVELKAVEATEVVNMPVEAIEVEVRAPGGGENGGRYGGGGYGGERWKEGKEGWLGRWRQRR